MTAQLVLEYLIANPAFLAGLIDGEGCFYVLVEERVSKVKKLRRVQVSVSFYLGLNGHSRYVLEAVLLFFGCGGIYTSGVKSGFFFSYQIKAIDDICNILIPFLDKHPLLTIKLKDYMDFRTVAMMIQRGEHLTPSGLAKIRAIKSGMNTQRFKK